MPKKLLALVLTFSVIWIACETEPGAKDTVLEFINKLRSGESFELDQYLDLNQLVRENAPNLYHYDTSLSIQQNIQEYKRLFEPDGRIRKLWTDKQIVIGETETLGDTAYVEVSFIDKQTRKQYYNKWGLRKTDQDWIIFAFKLL
jgi:hypothetical protein